MYASDFEVPVCKMCKDIIDIEDSFDGICYNCYEQLDDWVAGENIIDGIENIVGNLVVLLNLEREKVEYLATMLAAYDKKHIGIERAEQREVWKDAADIAARDGWKPAEGE